MNMADRKYLDPGGVTYLWGKIKALMGISGGSEGFATVEQLDEVKESLKKINYISNEEAEYTEDLGIIQEDVTKELPASLFDYGKAKKIMVSITVGKEMLDPISSVYVTLPAEGKYFLQGLSGEYFRNGGDTIWTIPSDDIQEVVGTEHTITFYCARVYGT